MFDLLGRIVVNHPWKTCGVWFVMGLLLALAAPAWDTHAQDDDIRFLPDRCPSVRGHRLLEKAFPQDVFASKAVFVLERRQGTLTKTDFALADRLTAALENLRSEQPGLRIRGISSYRDLVIGSRLTSTDRRCTLIQMSLACPFLAEQTRRTIDRAESRLRQLLAQAGPQRPVFYTTGTAGVGRDLTGACADGLEGTTLATVLLVVVTLLVVYRAPLLALVPLLTIAVSVIVSLKVLALLTLLPGVHLVNISKVFAIVILYGAGTDYCLFLVSRYREELRAGYTGPEALRRCLGGVGGALTASAGTVMCGLGLMVLAEFAKVRYAGPAIALSLGIGLAASLTLTPALIRLLGAVVFWPGGVPVAAAQLGPADKHWAARPGRTVPTTGLWNRISRLVMLRPALVWATAVLVLLPLALVGLRVEADYRAAGELPPGSNSVQGLAAIQRHFTAGETGPITVLLSSPTNWNSRAGRDTIDYICRSFMYLGNVAEVRSLTQPLGKPLPEPLPSSPDFGFRISDFGFRQAIQVGFDLALEGAQAAARRYYVSSVSGRGGRRSVTRLDVVLQSDPFDPASQVTLRLIQAFLHRELSHCTLPPGGVTTECYGATVNARDLAEVTGADGTRVNLLVLAGIFLILLVLVRKPWLAAYLLATVLFSYLAALGATALVGALWSGRPLHQIDWRVPFFLFIILVAVGEDYNILLVTRALQERSKHGARKGIYRALSRTGGTITSCGFIMAATFGTLMLAGLGTLQQIGFALAFGVLLDTFVVRPFLVPAFILMVWRRRPEPEAARPARPERGRPRWLRQAG
jgi:RND superfamily putative drug exporter